MMSYTRFKRPYDIATLATLATLQPKNPQSVANVATVATSQGQNKDFWVDSVATVARPEFNDAPPYDGPYADALRALQYTNPTDDGERWGMAKRDARAFLDRWGEQAALLGWSDLDLFGLHPADPLVRYDCMGLIWLLRGRHVVCVEAHRAKLSNGQSIYRGHWPAIVTGGLSHG